MQIRPPRKTHAETSGFLMYSVRISFTRRPLLIKSFAIAVTSSNYEEVSTIFSCWDTFRLLIGGIYISVFSGISIIIRYTSGIFTRCFFYLRTLPSEVKVLFYSKSILSSSSKLIVPITYPYYCYLTYFLVLL